MESLRPPCLQIRKKVHAVSHYAGECPRALAEACVPCGDRTVVLRLQRKLAQTQHSNHEPQTACNLLSSNELWHADLREHCERLVSVR